MKLRIWSVRLNVSIMMPDTYAMLICWGINASNIEPLTTVSLQERQENQFSDKLTKTN